MHQVLRNSTLAIENQRTDWKNSTIKFGIYPKKSWRTGDVLENGKRVEIVSIHRKEKQLNLGICSQLVYLPIHGTNNPTTDHKTLEWKDVSRTADMYLSGVNRLKPISFTPETQQQALFVGKKKWLSVVLILKRFFITVLEDTVRSNMAKLGWEETALWGQYTGVRQAVVREQLPMVTCPTEWVALGSLLGQSVMQSNGGKQRFLFALKAGKGCGPGGEWVRNVK